MTNFFQVVSFDPLLVDAPEGPKGDTGAAGPVGATGATGATGPQGNPGTGVSDYSQLTGKPTLGTAAAKDVGTGATNVAAGQHASTHGNGGTDPVSVDASQVASGLLAIARVTDAALTDGQLVAYSSTLGKLTAVNPSGTSELAQASNVTGTVTAFSASGALGTAVDIPGVTISVPASNGRPVVIEFGVSVQQTAVGDGDVYLNLVETTGTPTTLKSAICRAPNSITTATLALTLESRFRLGVVSSTRTFKLSIQVWAPTSNTPALRTANASNAPSYIAAVAR